MTEVAKSLARKLQERIELAALFGSEAEDSPLWPTLNVHEMRLLHESTDGEAIDR